MGTLWDEVLASCKSGPNATLAPLPPRLSVSGHGLAWPGYGGTFLARDIQSLKGRTVRVIDCFHGAEMGSVGEIGEGRRTPSGWMLEVRWTEGSQVRETDWLTRTEAERHLVLDPL